MLRKPIVIIITTWVAIILVVAAFTVRFPNIRQKYSVPQQFASATAAFGSNSAVFSNGQELAAYNYTTGQLTKLTGDVGLGSIDTVSVSPDSNYTVFHAQLVAQNGTLAATLQSQDLNPALDYWWLYDAQTQQYTPLKQGTLLAKADNSHVYTLSYSSGSGEAITTYQAANLQKLSDISVSGCNNFFVVQNGFLLQTTDNKVLLTKDGVVNRQLLTGSILAGVTNDGQSALAVTTQNNTRNLTLINLQDDSTTTVTQGISNVPIWLNTGIALYTTANGKLSSYDVQTHKSSVWRLGSAFKDFSPADMRLISLLGPKAAVAGDSTGDYYLIGNGLAQTKAIQ